MNRCSFANGALIPDQAIAVAPVEGVILWNVADDRVGVDLATSTDACVSENHGRGSHATQRTHLDGAVDHDVGSDYGAGVDCCSGINKGRRMNGHIVFPSKVSVSETSPERAATMICE